ncbi:MAG: bifunctional folylpolyglutamate synthase/dihydrofolate synthase [Tannerella sp.]|jgi:dihydrofolate synthase/folylpolyglutamate synthase|nr:bifunctional folylpolyglutamate synthase/dihydrofolate synthase [Tannerella sp.]
MTYHEALAYLYASTPVFEQVGAAAYKPGLGNMEALDEALGHPHLAYPSLHVAGTNGKGSVCHTLAAVLQAAGYKVGLYTSPHLLDFRERIRVNGEMVDEAYVCDFVEKQRPLFERVHPSFFEVATAMAFAYFRKQAVDIAVIETGLGGRLDSTNIIRPLLSVITNISLDHTAQLGNTLEKIAFEKAGIIKKGIPVVIGDTGPASVEAVFRRKASEEGVSLVVAAQEACRLVDVAPVLDAAGRWQISSIDYGRLTYELPGEPQKANALTALCALRELRTKLPKPLQSEAVAEGFARVGELTGLHARWETVAHHPDIVLDVAHNPGAWKWTVRRLEAEGRRRKGKILVVAGFCADKDVPGILHLLAGLPKGILYILTQADSHRAMPAEELAGLALDAGLQAVSAATVGDAVAQALKEAAADDLLLVSGSHYVVAEAMAYLHKKQTS